ncbi:hypothetical protein Ga0466249_004763 [Sporomusaceae bacterium BoRhaA]|uniref:site-specific DNA-methyltransferase n=1 Tax=Pelorhabdus rhamnosifermentans TaxID=2772457 RepID=UPI001C05F378|nr:site-specific DNA-methyltransferase [Pelorhabdus rhamnosifermentans]MBU2703618.1 hypothetical protein [Pelorhabdus rhamnosifermentans]
MNTSFGVQKEAVKKLCIEDHGQGAIGFQLSNQTNFIMGKPTPLMERLVSIVPEESIILDPFAGSGTTLVAAKNTDRQFIGIEKGKEYAAVAGKRLSA